MSSRETHYLDSERAAILHALADSLNHPPFQQLVEITAQGLQTPIGFLSVLDGANCRYPVTSGVPNQLVTREASLCDLAVRQERPTLISDLRDQPSTSNRTPLSDCSVRCYAAIPLVHQGIEIGMIGGMGPSVQQFGDRDRDFLQRIKQIAESALETANHVENQELLASQSAELWNTRERLETAMSGGDVGLWDWNVLTDEVYFSPVWHSQVGVSPGTLHDLEAWRSRVHPDDLGEAMRRVQACFDGNETEYESIFRMRHVDGSYRTILARGKKFVGEDDRPRRLIGVHIDITERRQNEIRLAVELQRKADFLRILERGLLAQTVDEVIQWLPGEIREMLGTHIAQVSVVNRNDWDQADHGWSLSEKYESQNLLLQPPEYSGAIMKVCQSDQVVMISQDELTPYPNWYWDGHSMTPTGQPICPPLRGWLAVPLTSSHGNNLGLLQVSDKCQGEFTASDQPLMVQFGYIASICIERLVAQEEERERSRQLEVALIETEFQARSLASSNLELEQFANVASHDLRSPLRGISNLSQWIAEDTQEAGIELPDQVKSHLSMLENQVQRMDNLLVGLLAFSRAGHEEFEPEPVDLNELLSSVVSMAGTTPGFEVIFPLDLPTLLAKRSPLERVFLNLITNSIKHHDRETGQIVIECDVEDEHYLEFSITDDGPGIPAEYRGQVFDLYRTLDSKAQAQSSGMGLSIIKKLIESSGGKIWIEDADQRGARFRFRWPKNPD